MIAVICSSLKDFSQWVDAHPGTAGRLLAINRAENAFPVLMLEDICRATFDAAVFLERSYRLPNIDEIRNRVEFNLKMRTLLPKAPAGDRLKIDAT